jgi:hypothetical protein
MLGYFHTPPGTPDVPLNGLQRHFRDLRVQSLSEPVGGRSWCLTGHMPDTSERLLITTVIERWSGKIVPEIMIRSDVFEHT